MVEVVEVEVAVAAEVDTMVVVDTVVVDTVTDTMVAMLHHAQFMFLHQFTFLHQFIARLLSLLQYPNLSLLQHPNLNPNLNLSPNHNLNQNLSLSLSQNQNKMIVLREDRNKVKTEEWNHLTAVLIKMEINKVVVLIVILWTVYLRFKNWQKRENLENKPKKLKRMPQKEVVKIVVESMGVAAELEKMNEWLAYFTSLL